MSSDRQPIRVLVVDDHDLFRDGVVGLLSRAEDVLVVGEAAHGEQAVRLAAETHPDVVLMDINMPGMSGIEATTAILSGSENVRVIMLTMFEDDESVFAALRAGALGYVLKDASRGTLLRAVRAAASGEALLAPSVARRVLLQARPAPERAGPRGVLRDLSARELEVLSLICRGLRNRDLARHLSVSEKTVQNHITSIFFKLQVSNRAEAIRVAQEHGLPHTGR